MMWAEFEGLLGGNVTASEWKVIECCYMSYDVLFPDKASVVKTYKNKGYEYFKQLAKPILELRKEMDAKIFEERKEKEALQNQIRELQIEKEKNKPNLQTMDEILNDMFRTYYGYGSMEALIIIDERGNEYKGENPIKFMQQELPTGVVELIGMCVNNNNIVSVIRRS